MAKEKKKMPKGVKIPLIVVISLAATIVTVIGSLSLLKYAIYADFYKTKKNVCAIPGLNNGGVPQGICYNEDLDTYFISEYSAKKGKPTRIYTVKDDKATLFELYKDGNAFTGHAGGIACDNNYVYLANGGGIYTIEISLFNASREKTINLTTFKKVNNQASFVYTNDAYLYVGEFHDEKTAQYTLHHDIETSEGTNHAIVARYPLMEFSPAYLSNPIPDQTLSIRKRVQGFAVTDDNRYVLSTSWGVSTSHLYVYNSAQLNGTYTDDNGVITPCYHLVNADKDMKAPPMFEDLDFSNGRIITLTESACDKYIFGKFFGAYYAFSVAI